jgi:hypothetical protein
MPFEFSFLGFTDKNKISLQRNRVRAKQKAHTRQNALFPMRSAQGGLSLKRRFVAFLLPI